MTSYQLHKFVLIEQKDFIPKKVLRFTTEKKRLRIQKNHNVRMSYQLDK